MRLILAVVAMSLCAPVVAGEEHDHMKQEAVSNKDFDLIKSLAGDWKSTGDMEGKPMESRTTFRVTSAGSAVVETMAVGTPHEMTNVYHLVDGKLMMTHYCAIGNAPLMKVVKDGSDSVTFETVKANGIDPKKTPHMHGLSYKLADKDHFTATWTSANMPKEHASSSVFTYTRVP